MTLHAGGRDAAILALALVAVAVVVTLGAAGPAPPLRHLYLVPVVIAALRHGPRGGLTAAAGALLLEGPRVLPAIERAGVTPASIEGLVTFGLLLAAGGVVGALSAAARRQRARYEAVLAVRRTLAGAPPALPLALNRLRAFLAHRLAARALALAVRDGDEVVVAGGERLDEGSLAARVLASGRAAFVADTGTGARPRRVLAAPLVANGACVGVLVLEREGELSADDRDAVVTLGADIGLALDNARLAARQRRFADELAAKVDEATRRLSELDRAKSTFVTTASHELRTPLAALLGFSELLATRDLARSEVRRLAGIMVDETRRLGRIVADLLDVARIERGTPPPLRREAVAVGPLLAAVAALFQRDGVSHRVVVECAAPLPALDADPDAVERILTNLIGNALKYAPGGSEVRLVARPAEAPGAVEFVVADEGPGIPADALPHVFEPYFRAPASAGAAPGTGLGLAVVRSLVEAHGGAVAIASAAGTGTRVTFRLPARAPVP
jgi:two-component system sensor histidine kinase KdpD